MNASRLVRRAGAPLARSLLAGVLLAAAALAAHAWIRSSSEARMADAARAFLATLDGEQRKRATEPFDSAVRKDWHFVPRKRAGLPLGDMSDAQRASAHALLRAALSSRGYLKVTGLLRLEALLREIESSPMRDPGRYNLLVFGEPGGKTWGWKLEGHHLVLGFNAIDGTVACTPLFLGANPARVPSGPESGWRVLALEEDLGRELASSLTSEQKTKATLAGDTPRDVLLGPGRDARFEKAEGITAADLDAPQRALLERLLDEILGGLDPDLAAQERARLDARGFEKIRFAWSGGLKSGEPHYWRLSDGRFAVEYDNVQDGANHVHVLWRDLERDFGEDLLKRHWELEHAGEKR